MTKFKVLKECNVEGVVREVGSVIEADAEVEAKLVADGYLEAIVEDTTPGETTGEQKVADEEVKTDEVKTDEEVAPVGEKSEEATQ